MDTVTRVLNVRSRPVAGLDRMVGVSAVAHLVLVAAVALVPSSWLTGRAEREPEAVMTISLGGPPGPRDGGMTPMGGRPVQQETPVETKRPIQPNRPPAAREPEMIEPVKKAPKRPAAQTKVQAQDPRGRTPTTGDQVRSGSAVAETGGRGQGFGLTQGGGGTGAYLDVGDFCCPEYLSLMLDLINRNWSSRQQAIGTTVVRFVIQRDGRLTDIQVSRSSGYPALDLLATRALTLTGQLPPLPAAYTGSSLTVNLVFEYQR